MTSSIANLKSRTRLAKDSPQAVSPRRTRNSTRSPLMVRTQSGTIPNHKFKTLSVQLDATPSLKPLKHISAVRSSKVSNSKRIFKVAKTAKPKQRKVTHAGTDRDVSPLPAGFEQEMTDMQERIKAYMPTKLEGVGESVKFFPSIAWGENEEVGRSVIGRADREIEIWEEVRRSHVEGKHEAVPWVEMKLNEAKAKRATLEDCEANHRIGKIDAGEIAIQKQIEGLEWALNISNFEPERENLRGAIAAYKSGEIRYSKHFSILYAGKVVDTAVDYASFVKDRQERLDRYEKAHGPHWLFYEAPLDVHPDTKPTMMMATATLDRAQTWSNLGPYHIQQGFWKRYDYVNRMPTMIHSVPVEFEREFWSDRGRVACQDPGPNLAFRSLLDTGSTYPSLYREDFERLAIDDRRYSCQAVQILNTANGPVTSRIFELFVSVLDNNKRQLVDPDDCVWEYHSKYLGGLCPVVEMKGTIQYDDAGRERCTRLSGLLPFLACYVSSTPTVDALFLGEDRKDVLGYHRMPGQKKWDIAIPPAKDRTLERTGHDKFGEPRVIFNHRGGQIVDEDHPTIRHASRITINPGEANQFVQVIHPEKEISDREDRRQAGTL